MKVPCCKLTCDRGTKHNYNASKSPELALSTEDPHVFTDSGSSSSAGPSTSQQDTKIENILTEIGGVGVDSITKSTDSNPFSLEKLKIVEEHDFVRGSLSLYNI